MPQAQGSWVTRMCAQCPREYECLEGGVADRLGLCAPCALAAETAALRARTEALR